MDSTNLCNALRMEFEGVFENKIPLNAFPVKIQDMILVLSRQENYSIEYMMASLLVAMSTAIGNAVNIRIRGCLLYTSPSPRDAHESRMPSSA